MHTPSGTDLLRIEQQARTTGSGVCTEELRGCWHLETVWSRNGEQTSAFNSWMLRRLNARLELAPEGQGVHSISNAVNLGSLELRFQGRAALSGRRPLLRFQFELLTLSLAGRTMLERRLPAPPERRKPFFALIARDPTGWLAARGRGGGLALWTLRD